MKQDVIFLVFSSYCLLITLIFVPSGQRDADHIHQGLGFVPQHIKLTNMFEASMQAVNPAVTMPYWDFTMDVAEGKTIYESVMFTEKTFGTMTKPADLERGFLYKYDDMGATAIQGTMHHPKAICPYVCASDCTFSLFDFLSSVINILSNDFPFR